jgi:hypothetical protein
VSRVAVQIGWSDVPHLDAKAKDELFKSFPPYQRDARSKGIPQLGSGAIYPIPESDVFIDPIDIPPWWRRSYGLDVGWNRTAAVWSAYDEDVDTLYLTHEYERSMAEPSVHVGAIRLRGTWIPGVIDPASRGRGQKDGEQLLQNYRDLGLDLTLANNAVEAGLFAVFQRMTTGRLKIFSSLIGVRREFRLYRRDEKGHVVKQDDHLMDAMRYDVMSGIGVARVSPKANEEFSARFKRGSANVANADWKAFD